MPTLAIEQINSVPLMVAPGGRVLRFDVSAAGGDDLSKLVRSEIGRLAGSYREMEDLQDRAIYVDATDYVENADDEIGSEIPSRVNWPNQTHTIRANLYRAWWQAGEFVLVYLLEVEL